MFRKEENEYKRKFEIKLMKKIQKKLNRETSSNLSSHILYQNKKIAIYSHDCLKKNVWYNFIKWIFLVYRFASFAHIAAGLKRHRLTLS